MNRIFLATSNDIKYNQYREIFKSLGFELSKAPIFLKMIEPQIEDEGDISNLIVEHPLKMVARFVKSAAITPYLVEDSMLFIESLSKNMDKGIGLPGGDTKNWWKNLGSEGLLDVMRNDNTRRAMMVCTIGAIDYDYKIVKTTVKLFGHISDKIRINDVAITDVPLSNPFCFHQLFIPEDSYKTYAEMGADEFIVYDYRRRCAQQLADILLAKMYAPQIIQLELPYDADSAPSRPLIPIEPGHPI